MLFLIFMSNFIGADFLCHLLYIPTCRVSLVLFVCVIVNFLAIFFPASRIPNPFIALHFLLPFGCLFLLCHIHAYFFFSRACVLSTNSFGTQNSNEAVWSHRRSLAIFRCIVHWSYHFIQHPIYLDKMQDSNEMNNYRAVFRFFYTHWEVGVRGDGIFSIKTPSRLYADSFLVQFSGSSVILSTHFAQVYAAHDHESPSWLRRIRLQTLKKYINTSYINSPSKKIAFSHLWLDSAIIWIEATVE